MSPEIVNLPGTVYKRRIRRKWWPLALFAILTAAGLLVMAGTYFHFESQLRKWPFVYNTVIFDPNERYISLIPKNHIVIPAVVLPSDNNIVDWVFHGKLKPEIQKRLDPWTRAKVFPFDSLKEYLSSESLVWGRMPRDGADEALAGFAASNCRVLKLGEKEYTIVGRLRSEASIINNCYLAGSARDGMYAEQNKDVLMVFIILPQFDKHDINTEENTHYRSEMYAGASAYLHTPMYARNYFCWYITGLALVLAGGSGLFIYLYTAAAARLNGTWFGRPLTEIAKHRKLLIGLHILLFGLVIVGQSIGYRYPALRFALHQDIDDQYAKSQMSNIVSLAYYSNSVAAAATMTFLNNYIGSFVYRTLPSVIIPGSGIFYQIWLSPLFVSAAPIFGFHAGGMICHSIVYLVEIEGYIIACFFGLLVPVYLFDKQRGKFWKRYRQGLLINAQGQIIIGIILAVSAIYEAIELLNGWGG